MKMLTSAALMLSALELAPAAVADQVYHSEHLPVISVGGALVYRTECTNVTLD